MGVTGRLLALALVGCDVDNALKQAGDGPGSSLDDTSPASTGIVDTDSSSPGDSADEDACEEQEWAAEAITQVEECQPSTELRADPLSASGEARWETDDPTYSESAPVVGPFLWGLSVAYTTTTGDLALVVVDDGRQVWSVGGLDGDPPGAAAFGDLDGDGTPDAVAAGRDAARAVTGEGTELWSQSGSEQWRVCSAPAVADLDADGVVEVVWGNRIYEGLTGALRGLGAHGMGSACCGGAAIGVVADVDLDGALDVVVGNALYDADGGTLWYNGEEDGFVAVANFDDDEYAEIVVTGDDRVRLQDDDGTVLWDGEYFPEEDTSQSDGGPPAIGDFDADGRPEIAVAGDDRIYVLEGTTGAVVWEAAKLSENSGWGGTSAFDIDGDGDDDVLTGDMEHLYVLDGSTGAELLRVERTSETCTETPVIADIDGDGHGEILVDGTVWTSAGDPWAEARPIWNQHAFSLTNVEDDGTIPTYPEPNWLSYNNFRSATLRVPDGYRGPDLIGEIATVCHDQCDAGEVVVWVRLGNQGYGDVETDVEVEVWGTTSSGSSGRLGGVTWTDTLPAGVLSASQEITLRGFDATISELWVEVDGGDDRMAGVVEECDETNNVAQWNELVCL